MSTQRAPNDAELEAVKREIAESYVNEQLATMKKYGSLKPGYPTALQYEKLVRHIAELIA